MRRGGMGWMRLRGCRWEKMAWGIFSHSPIHLLLLSQRLDEILQLRHRERKRSVQKGNRFPSDGWDNGSVNSERQKLNPQPNELRVIHETNVWVFVDTIISLELWLHWEDTNLLWFLQWKKSSSCLDLSTFLFVLCCIYIPICYFNMTWMILLCQKAFWVSHYNFHRPREVLAIVSWS